jgi:hypothetical protein
LILEKTLMALVAGAAVVTATAVSVVALAFALYAALEGPVGPAGSAALVGVVGVVLLALVGLIAANRGRGHGRHHGHGSEHDQGLAERLIDIVKERPLVSAAAAVAAGVLAMRNPALVGVILTAFLGRKDDDKR